MGECFGKKWFKYPLLRECHHFTPRPTSSLRARRLGHSATYLTLLALAIALCNAAIPFEAYAEDQQAEATPAETETETGTLDSALGEKSPWLLAPLFNSNPKLGTSLGVLGGYLHYFDEKSRPSIFALQGQYSTTDSIVSGVFAKTSFDEDRQRLTAGMVYGYVNDYSNYLRTGVPLQSNANLHQFSVNVLRFN